MSFHRDPWILCDGCDDEQYPEDAGEDAFVDVTIGELRAAAMSDGWSLTRDRRDLCPSCAHPEGVPR